MRPENWWAVRKPALVETVAEIEERERMELLSSLRAGGANPAAAAARARGENAEEPKGAPAPEGRTEET